jgi:hypothetical protein
VKGLAACALLLTLVATCMAMALAAALGAATPSSAAGAPDGSCGWSALGRKDIPLAYQAIYAAAAATERLDCAILAAIGRVETDHGRLDAPGVTSGTNGSGAAGPCQFLIPTWELSGIGDGGDVYDPRDCVPAMARYLKKGGAPGNYHAAILSYNHADWYVQLVLSWADRYRGDALPVPSAPADLATSMTPKEIIDTVVLPLAAACCDIRRTPAENDAANAVHGPTTTGGHSDHQGPPDVAWAADMSNGTSPTPEMDKLAETLAQTFGMPWAGSGVTATHVAGFRVQMLYKTDIGGNHFGHVHLGVRRD